MWKKLADEKRYRVEPGLNALEAHFYKCRHSKYSSSRAVSNTWNQLAQAEIKELFNFVKHRGHQITLRSGDIVNWADINPTNKNNTTQAMLTDGLLDVTILEPFTVLDVPSLSFQLFNKTIDQNSRIKTFRCQTLRIHRTKPGVVHFDGDPMMMGENIDVKVIKEGLQVIIPRYAEKDSSNVLQRAQDYINGLKQINEEIVHKNKMILDKSKEQIKKLTKI